jgi:hypothetical protein
VNLAHRLTVRDAVPNRQDSAGYVGWLLLYVFCEFNPLLRRHLSAGPRHPRIYPSMKENKENNDDDL